MAPLRSTHARRRPPRPGFTLIELLIVVAVIAIIGLLALPAGSNVGLQRLRSAARLLIADLEYAQLLSIGDGADPCVVVFDAAANEYWIARRSDPGTPITDPGTRQPYRTRYGQGRAATLDGVTLAGVDAGGDDRLEFTALGAIEQGTDASIVLRSGSDESRIVVDAATGEPRVE